MDQQQDPEIIPTPSIKDVKELDQNLCEWLRIGKLIEEYEVLLKELKVNRLKLQEKNIEFMKLNELDFIQLGPDKKISLVETRNKVSNITKTRLPSKLVDYFMKKRAYDSDRSHNLTDEIMEFLETEPVYTVNSYLKKYEKKI